MKTPCFVGIDTSNYTTSLAICTTDGEVVANLKCPLPVKEGERGLRQSDAVFLHTKNIPLLFEKAKPYLEAYQPIAIGVSARPRTQEGSYMPCFLAGKATASALGAALSVPVYEFSHQNGHIMAAHYGSNAPKEMLDERFIAFHVSGGTTEVLLVSPDDFDFRCEIVGGTLDMNAGQAIDRVGVVMGLHFPCGPEMERFALSVGETRSKGIRTSVKGGKCNFSGLENQAIKLYEATGDKGKTAKYVLDFISETLAKITEQIRAEHPALPILYGGGVMSCSVLQKRLAGDAVYFSNSAFSSDNAAGVALLTRRKHLKI